MADVHVVLAGRYRLESRIAAGGVGEVWRAVDLVLARQVAVKVLRPEYAGHPETLARFRAEARHAGSVSHPGIAMVYDYGEDGAGAPYLVMELVDGPSLAGVLAAGPVSPAQAMEVLAQAASGLQAAHAAGLVHRDVKPGNLLIGPDGQVKITDFGIAYAAGTAPITRTGILVGTPAYLAPERAAGAPATPASDLYSLGVAGYECLTGTAPFRGLPVEVAAAHRYGALPPLPASVPTGVAGLIAELTAKDPAARPASAGEVATRAARLRDALPGPASLAALGTAAGAGSRAATAPEAWAGDRAATAPRAAAGTGAATAPGAWPGDRAATAPRAAAGTGAATAPGARASDRAATAPGAWPGDRAATAKLPVAHGDPLPVTVADPAGRMSGRGGPRPPRRRARRGHRLVPVIALAVVVGLVGWLLASLSGGAAPPHRQAAGPRPTAGHTAGTPAVHTVAVNAGALAGQPVALVSQRLRQRGLRPRVIWVAQGGQDPATVVSVRPSGQVPAGSVVTVIAALAPPGHRHHHHGHGHGGGDGGGGDGGGGGGG